MDAATPEVPHDDFGHRAEFVRAWPVRRPAPEGFRPREPINFSAPDAPVPASALAYVHAARRPGTGLS